MSRCARGEPQRRPLLAFARMDGAPLLSMSISQDKAYTVTAFGGIPTHDWFEFIKDEPE